MKTSVDSTKKTVVSSLLLLLFTAVCFLSISIKGFCQIVVPHGWETKDSIRFGLWFFPTEGNYNSTLTPFTDTMGVRFEMGYDNRPPTDVPGGKRIGISTQEYGQTGQTCGLMSVAERLKERIFYPSPDVISPHSVWRYNAINVDTAAHAKWYNNTYDANDISPFAEYPQNPIIVKDTFRTRSYDSTVNTLVHYGNEGRIILGYSDKRNATDLLTLMGDQLFTTILDTPKVTNAILEFNINRDTIDMGSATSSIDSVPLLRVQILFKEGTPDNQAVLPFVPFKTASNPHNHGWWKIIDTVITRNNYDRLTDSYRTQDSVNGNIAHPWKFKQLHLILRPPPNMQMDSLFHLEKTHGNSDYYNLRNKYAQNTDGSYGTITHFVHPDSLVNEQTDPTNTPPIPLLEIRILSTYRATVRVRSLSYHDELADKFLYRARFSDTVHHTDSTHSLNADGTYGGLDDSLIHNINLYANQIPAGLQREIEFIDYIDEWNYLSLTGTGLLEYLISKRNMNTHIHEQWSEWIEEFRRSKMSQDGKPPSMYENEASRFSAGRSQFNNGSGIPGDIFPADYVYYGLTPDYTHQWPLSANDSMVGQMFIGRYGASVFNTSDSLYAYHRYTDIYGGMDFLSYKYRQSAITALRHPPTKRFAIEASPQGWGLIHTLAYNAFGIYHHNKDITDTIPTSGWRFPKNGTLLPGAGISGPGTSGRDSIAEDPSTKQYYAYYYQRPTTPEETSVLIYGALANGATCFSNAQPFEFGTPTDGVAGMFAPGRRTSRSVPTVENHTYNFGHQRSEWDTSSWTKSNLNECDSPLPDYYLGYANTFKAFKRAFARINQIYDTTHGRGAIPFRRFSWVDAYSTSKAINQTGFPALSADDSTSRAKAFIKCFCTTPVKRWSRGSHGEYIDSIHSGQLVPDSSFRTYAEVGIFKDSIDSQTSNYSALVVNTRLWPSLRDADDSIYYNQGLDSTKDQSRSTLGDIDVRKVWFTTDTTKMDAASRSTYYVVRDLWHPDSTWLLKNDSSFAIYIKPGDAKFLYFEKGVAIRMAKTAATEELEYAYNNGRRVAEIMGGTRTIATYVRGGKLFVSYPRKGATIEGGNERSSGDNIATGNELLLDSIGSNRRPSIIAGMNDTAVGIVYWNADSSGRIKAAYQKHPDSAWLFTSYTQHAFQDTTLDGSGVTPVITPYADLLNYTNPYTVGMDSIWWIAAGYQGTTGNPADPQGIAALRLKIYRDSIRFTTEAMQYFYKNLAIAPRDASVFPTIASRPIEGSKYPVRLAWQNYSKILYNRFKDVSGTITQDLTTPFVVSDGLPSFCYNRHPSIAFHILGYRDAGVGIGTGIGCGCCCIPHESGRPTIQGVGPDTMDAYKGFDEVVWESKLYGNQRWNTNNNYWPVLRQRIEYLHTGRAPIWSSFRVFKPYVDSQYFHYPNVSAASRSDTNTVNQNNLKKKPVYYDDVRIAWQDKPDNVLDFAHWIYAWKRSILLEAGSFPSLPQSTFPDAIGSLKFRIDSSIVPQSVGFAGIQTDNGKQLMRITNGWFPKVSKQISVNMYPSIVITSNLGALVDCKPVSRKDDYGGIAKILGPGIYETKDWLAQSGVPTSPIGMMGMPFATDTINRTAFYSDSMVLIPGDSIVIARKIDTLNLTAIRTALADSNDYFMIRTTLRRVVDTAYIATIDSSIITKGVAIYPGHGLDSNYATYRYPLTSPSDTAFILVEAIRKNLADSIGWATTEYYTDSTIPLQSLKNAPSPTALKEVSNPYLFVNVIPNPFSNSTTVKIKSAEGQLTNVEVFDVLGRKIAELFNGNFPDTPIEIRFEAAMLSAGAYFVRIQSGSEVITRKIQLVK